MVSVAEEHRLGGVQAGQAEPRGVFLFPVEGTDAHVKILLRKATAFLSSPAAPNCCPGVLQAQRSEAGWMCTTLRRWVLWSLEASW